MHRTVDCPSSSVFPRAQLLPCGWCWYPVLLTYGKEFDRIVAPFRPMPFLGVGWTPGTLRVPRMPCLVAGLLRPMELLPVLSDAECHAWVRGLGLCLPKLCICLLTRTTAAVVLNLVVAYVLDGAHATVGVVEECYLVDPASSHMLVSKIKPCMCKYELIQTVKLRMAH